MTQSQKLWKHVWITRDGQNIPIKDMSDQHLVNTINMINRNLRIQAERDYEAEIAMDNIGGDWQG